MHLAQMYKNMNCLRIERKQKQLFSVFKFSMSIYLPEMPLLCCFFFGFIWKDSHPNHFTTLKINIKQLLLQYDTIHPYCDADWFNSVWFNAVRFSAQEHDAMRSNMTAHPSSWLSQECFLFWNPLEVMPPTWQEWTTDCTGDERACWETIQRGGIHRNVLSLVKNHPSLSERSRHMASIKKWYISKLDFTDALLFEMMHADFFPTCFWCTVFFFVLNHSHLHCKCVSWCTPRLCLRQWNHLKRQFLVCCKAGVR